MREIKERDKRECMMKTYKALIGIIVTILVTL